jgi:hypothetical protein
VEVAAAAVLRVADSSFQSGTWDRLGAWVTASYLTEKPNVDIAAMLRLTSLRGEVDGTVAEYGAKVTYDVSPLFLSIEAVGRSAFDAVASEEPPVGGGNVFKVSSTHRLVGLIEYGLSNGSSVLLGFGRVFEDFETGTTPLFSTVGLRIGLGGIPKIGIPGLGG